MDQSESGHTSLLFRLKWLFWLRLSSNVKKIGFEGFRAFISSFSGLDCIERYLWKGMVIANASKTSYTSSYNDKCDQRNTWLSSKHSIFARIKKAEILRDIERNFEVHVVKLNKSTNYLASHQTLPKKGITESLRLNKCIFDLGHLVYGYEKPT